MGSADRGRCPNAIVFIPGVMSSELVDVNGHLVWGMSPRLVLRQGALGDVVARIALPLTVRMTGSVP